jgi:dihydrofolate reductase
VSSVGALVCGRTLFDRTDGWGGRHTLDVPVVVVTHRVPADWVDAHPEAPFTFVTDGVTAAVAHAQTLAGDRDVAVTGGTVARQCLDQGLLDEVAIDLVPVVMGEATAPSSASRPGTTCCSATHQSAFKATASLTWCSQSCADR